jgi:hypothetical protein
MSDTPSRQRPPLSPLSPQEWRDCPADLRDTSEMLREFDRDFDEFFRATQEIPGWPLVSPPLSVGD